MITSWIGLSALTAHTTIPIGPVDCGNSAWRPIHPLSNGPVGVFVFGLIEYPRTCNKSERVIRKVAAELRFWWLSSAAYRCRSVEQPPALIQYTAARWGIAASPAALSFIQGRARAKAPYQQDRTLAVAQPPKTPVVLRDSGGLTSNRKRHAPIRGEGTSKVG